MISCYVCCAVLPAVLTPSDQPGVLPEIQQLSPVRSLGQHPAVTRLQPEPNLLQMTHKHTEPLLKYISSIKLYFYDQCFHNFEGAAFSVPAVSSEKLKGHSSNVQWCWGLIRDRMVKKAEI